MNWHELMGNEFWVKANDLANEVCLPHVYPARNKVFAAFDEVDPQDVKVVILGQDPYHSPGKARGVAFGYHPNYKGTVNSSLANIILEAGGNSNNFDRSLADWTKQGVLLLNTRLTVPHEEPMGHADMGWEPLMDQVLDKICRYGQPIVLAWGAEARKMAQRAPAWTIIDTSHPCRYSASRGNKPFLGSNCFRQVNIALLQQGEDPINWSGEVFTTHE